MLLFSTVLNVNESLTQDAFIRLVIKWNQGSPHADNVIPNIEWNGERNIRYGSDTLWMAIEEYRNKNIIAVRYEKAEANGVVWDTDYVVNFDERKIAIRLDRSYTEDAIAVDPSFSTPYFIVLLIEEGYLAPDGDLPVLNKPITIDRDNIDLLAGVINGAEKYRMPVVYVSKTFEEEEPVDVKRLSRQLKGIAHVLVEEETSLDGRIREACGGKNEYHGAVGVYYPNPALSPRRFSYRGYDRSLRDKIVSRILRYNNTQKTDLLYTWQGVSNALLRDRLQSQRAERLAAESAAKNAKEQAKNAEKQAAFAAAEASELVDSVDEELKFYRKKIDELTRENEALSYENTGLRTKLNDRDEQPVLYLGDEEEFFPDEIKDMLLLTLEEKLSNTEKATRKADVLEDIITKNGGCQHHAGRKANEIKSLLQGYKNVSSTMKQSLMGMGFEITSDGKHYKLTYYGDSRYTVTIPKTPGDTRSGLNTARTIVKKVL